jgi:hypothetical protein
MTAEKFARLCWWCLYRIAHLWRAAFTRAMGSTPPFRHLMFAYVDAFLEQVLVSVACNGAQRFKERLARWLLMMHDRGDDGTLLITQDLPAETLGAQRPPSRMLPGSWNAQV